LIFSRSLFVKLLFFFQQYLSPHPSQLKSSVLKQTFCGWPNSSWIMKLFFNLIRATKQHKWHCHESCNGVNGMKGKMHDQDVPHPPSNSLTSTHKGENPDCNFLLLYCFAISFICTIKNNTLWSLYVHVLRLHKLLSPLSFFLLLFIGIFMVNETISKKMKKFM